jgi:hypothetical protein
MFFHEPSTSARSTHWVYDDPSGVPEAPLTVSLSEPLRGSVELAAASVGLSPSEWLARIVKSNLRPTTIRAI